MADPHIYHTTLNTGHTDKFTRAAVDTETLRIVAPWLKFAVAASTPQPLPLPALSRRGHLW